MKRLLFYLSLAVLLNELSAQTQPLSDEYVLKRVSERSGLTVGSLEFLQVAPPEKAWTAFKYITQYQTENPDLVKKAGRIMAENSVIERYATEGMAKLSHDFSNEDERQRFLTPLGYVPAPWSLRLLGYYLMDETPMKYPENPPDYGASTNQDLALLALVKMGFSDAPPEDHIYGLTPAVEKAWRDWWKANEGRVEQRIYEINPGYVPSQMQQPPTTATPIQTPISTPQVAPATPSSTTPKPTAALPSATPATTVQANRSSLLGYVVGALLVIGVLIAAVRMLRK